MTVELQQLRDTGRYVKFGSTPALACVPRPPS